MNEIIIKAMKFARKKHGDTLDDNGKNIYETHLHMVYKAIKLFIPKDYTLQAASLLHDTLEDTDTTYEELVKEFNQEVADLVMEVTHEGQKDEVGYYFPRLKTQKGILLKFADRLSNLSRMEPWDQKRRDQYLRKSKFWNSDGKKK
jgi:(p)ppGpp synthase/HD superfamily hydrolase